MRGHRAALIAILLVGIAAAAAAGDMTLTRHGDLYRVTPSDDGLVLNEVNTMPGFTPSSMFPQVWAVNGVDYPALVDRLLTTALARPLGLR